MLILGIVLLEAFRSLRHADVRVSQLDAAPAAGGFRADAMVEVAFGEARARFVVEAKRRAPYPNELPRLSARRQALIPYGGPLLVVPFVSEALGPALTADGWSWADGQGNFDLRAPGMVLRQRRTSTPPRPQGKRLPQGSGSLAIVRALIGFGQGDGEEASATALAAQAKVSQPRASQVLHQLQDLDLVDRSRLGRWTPRREALLDRFLSDYVGPRGSEQFFYSIDAPIDVAVRVASVRSRQRPAVVSADVGPDLLLAWRRPSIVILYTMHEIEPDRLGLVEAQGRHDANVIVRSPEDVSVFPEPELVAAVRGVDISLADPSQQIWDLQDLGGSDRLEAAGMLREWLLTGP